jgi:D-amino-acid dehydrogenase
VLSVSDESGESGLFCRALAQLAESRGMVLRLGCEVQRIEVAGGRVSAVQTTGGRIEADAFVCALGVIDPTLKRQLGAQLPIYPVKGYSATLPMRAGALLPAHAGIDETKLVAWCPMGDRLRVTGGAEFSGWGMQSRPADFTRLIELAEDLFPGLTEGAGIDPGRAQLRACQRPLTPESTPLFGTARHPNLWFNVGLGHMGWTMAAGAAQITADLVAGRTPAIDLEGFRVRPLGRA